MLMGYHLARLVMFTTFLKFRQRTNFQVGSFGGTGQ